MNLKELIKALKSIQDEWEKTKERFKIQGELEVRIKSIEQNEPEQNGIKYKEF